MAPTINDGLGPYCRACRATPKHGYCNLNGCPMPRPAAWRWPLVNANTGLPSGTYAVTANEHLAALVGGPTVAPLFTCSSAAYVAAVEQMLAHEQSGGDGWWEGWEMLKAAHSASAEPSIKSEWIEHGGGECPLPDGSVVDIRFGDGEEMLSQTLVPGHGTWAWDGLNHDTEVVAYRVVTLGDDGKVRVS